MQCVPHLRPTTMRLDIADTAGGFKFRELCDQLDKHSITQAVGFRCVHCSSEFKTRRAMECHRRKQSSQGTECADPSNSKSVSFTGRASIASSIVREHDFLGAYLSHMEVVYVHRQEDPRKLT